MREWARQVSIRRLGHSMIAAYRISSSSRHCRWTFNFEKAKSISINFSGYHSRNYTQRVLILILFIASDEIAPHHNKTIIKQNLKWRIWREEVTLNKNQEYTIILSFDEDVKASVIIISVSSFLEISAICHFFFIVRYQYKNSVFTWLLSLPPRQKLLKQL